MSRDLVLDVIAKKNSKDLNTLAAEFERLAKQTDDLGQRMHKTGSFSQFLDKELAKTKATVHELAAEVERTGDKDIFAKLRGAQSNVKSLERIKADLTKALETGVKDATASVGDLFSSLGRNSSKSFFETFSSMPPQAQAGIAAGVAGAVGLAAPAIGATIGGVILAGVGAVGIGAAIAGQMHDPAIERAGHDLGDHLKDNLTEATAPMGPVLLKAIEQTDAMVTRLQPKLASTFARMAPNADRFFTGMEHLVDNTLPGFEHGMEAGARILGDLGDSDLPRLGRAFSDLFDSISRGEVGASMAMHDLFSVIVGTVEAVGAAVEGAEHTFEAFSILAMAAGGNFSGAAMALAAVKDEAQHAQPPVSSFADTLGGVKDEAYDAAKALSGLNDELDATFRKHMDVDQAALRVNETMTALKESIKENGRHWDLNTQAGQRNWTALQAQIEADERARQANVKAGQSAIQAALEFNQHADAAFRVAAAAGAAKGQLDKMKGDYLINIWEIRHLVTQQAKANAVDKAMDRLTGQHASGGAAWGTFRVGEQGPEYVTLPDMAGPAYVTPNSAINGAANSGAPQEQVLRVILQYPDGQVIAEKLVSYGRSTNRRTFDTLIPVGSSR